MEVYQIDNILYLFKGLVKLHPLEAARLCVGRQVWAIRSRFKNLAQNVRQASRGEFSSPSWANAFDEAGHGGRLFPGALHNVFHEDVLRDGPQAPFRP